MSDPDLDDRLREQFEEDARDLEPSERLDDLVRQLREQRIRRRRWAARGLATVALVATVAVASTVLRSPDDRSSVVVDVATSGDADEPLFLVPGGSLPDGFELLAASGGNTPGMGTVIATAEWDRTQRWVRFDDAHEHPAEVIDIQWRYGKVLRDDVRSLEEQGWVERQTEGADRGSVVRVTGYVARGPDEVSVAGGSVTPLPLETLRQVLDDLTPRARGGFALASAPDGFELVGEWPGRPEAGTNSRLLAYGESGVRGFQVEIVDDSELPPSVNLTDTSVRLVTVRGEEGVIAPHRLGTGNLFDPNVVFVTSVSASVQWVEPGGELVTILAGGMTEDEVLAIADDLEAVDADTWFALYEPGAGVDPSGSVTSSTTVVFP